MLRLRRWLGVLAVTEMLMVPNPVAGDAQSMVEPRSRGHTRERPQGARAAHHQGAGRHPADLVSRRFAQREARHHRAFASSRAPDVQGDRQAETRGVLQDHPGERGRAQRVHHGGLHDLLRDALVRSPDARVGSRSRSHVEPEAPRGDDRAGETRGDGRATTAQRRQPLGSALRGDQRRGVSRSSLHVAGDRLDARHRGDDARRHSRPLRDLLPPEQRDRGRRRQRRPRSCDRASAQGLRHQPIGRCSSSGDAKSSRRSSASGA